MSAINKQSWGTSASGSPITLYTLRNQAGMEAKITNYGGRLASLRAPDRHGKFADIVLGFEHIDRYFEKNPYFGALIGRFANRIANARFDLNGHTYALSQNNGENTLHGGAQGFDKVYWHARDITSNGAPALELHYLSPDGEEGYPGNLQVTVRYSLSEDNELRLDYLATTDRTTVLNLTNHSYFDLGGAGSGKILDAIVTIHADRFTPVNEHLIPTGELRPVEGTPFDFRQATVVGSRINDSDQQLQYGAGYDHNYVLSRNGHEPSLAARALDPHSGRVLEVLTTQPGMQFYTGNHLDGSVEGKGAVYSFRTGMCFETQHFPDSPNQLQFPSSELHPGQQYEATTIFRLRTE